MSRRAKYLGSIATAVRNTSLTLFYGTFAALPSLRKAEKKKTIFNADFRIHKSKIYPDSQTPVHSAPIRTNTDQSDDSRCVHHLTTQKHLNHFPDSTKVNGSTLDLAPTLSDWV